MSLLSHRLDLELEPLFASMALYDAKEKKKISENFYFDMTPEPIKKMLANHIPRQDISTLSRSCIFSVTYPSPDIFIVIRVSMPCLYVHYVASYQTWWFHCLCNCCCS